MDFGDILDAWEKQTAIPQGDRKRRKLKLPHKEEMEKSGAGDGEKKKSPNAPSGEKLQRQPQQPSRSSLSHDALAAWLDAHDIYDKDADTEAAFSAAENRIRILRKKPDATIDLHNLTHDKAWQELEDFFQKCSARKLEKALIIHGKGNHSKGEAVLKRLVQKFIEKSPLAGESGYNPAKSGGSGATWVILKK